VARIKALVHEYDLNIRPEDEHRLITCYWELRKKLSKYDAKPLPDPSVIKPDEKVGVCAR
jgi:hypothetical protein